MATKKISIIQQTVNVLDCFVNSENKISLAEFCRMVDIPKSTLHRILISLVDADVLDYDEHTSDYSLRGKVLTWGGCMLHHMGKEDIIRSYLEMVRDKTGETAAFSVIVGTKRMYVMQVESNNEVRSSVDVRKLIPLYAGANGKALLAFSNSDMFERVLEEEGLQALTSTTITDRDRLEAELDKVRREGVSISYGERVAGLVGVAVPVFAVNGDLTGSISISGPSTRVSIEKAQEWGSLLKDVAKKITWSLVGINK